MAKNSFETWSQELGFYLKVIELYFIWKVVQNYNSIASTIITFSLFIQLYINFEIPLSMFFASVVDYVAMQFEMLC